MAPAAESGGARQPQRPTADDYARAERFLPWHARRLVYRSGAHPHWLPEDRCWYCVDTPAGPEIVTVDPAGPVARLPIDRHRVASAIGRRSGRPISPDDVAAGRLAVRGRSTVEVKLDGETWLIDMAGDGPAGALDAAPDPAASEKGAVRSPGGDLEALIRDHNVIVRSLATGEEVTVTGDGRPGLAYGTPIASPLEAAGVGVRGSPEQEPPVCLWAPDGRSLLTYRIDEARSGRLDWVQSVPRDGSLRPRHHSAPYPLPGDDEVPRAELVMLDPRGAARPRTVGPAVPLLYYGSPLASRRVWWSPDAARIYVVLRGRGYLSVSLTVVDLSSATWRTVIEERSDVPVDPGFAGDGRPAIRVLDCGERVLWYSQRDGWGHLYLYDGRTGEVVRQLTSGEWTVLDIAHVDEGAGLVYFTACGREPGRDPYFVHLYRVPLSGGPVELLTPEDATHDVSVAPGGTCFIDRYSRLDRPPVSILRASDGGLIHELETADTAALDTTGWRPPERFRARARDGVTDVYGVLFLPSGFDAGSGRRLPIVDDIYAGPQTNRAPVSFAGLYDSPSQHAGFWHAQAIAELGFAVVMIDGLGMPRRSKAFHDRSFRDLADGGIADHVSAIHELAQRLPHLDATRVGVYGHSAGGYASARAILAFPDFYKVAVSSAGNHDHRLDKAVWVERYMGLPVGPHYEDQANASLAENLRGKLLLVHGDMDENVHPASTMRLAEALIAANRDFDLLIMPNRPHALATDPYFVRRRWDYLVRHLLGATPPFGYRIMGPEPG